MSKLEYPNLLTIRVLEDNDKADMGLFTFSQNVELSDMVVSMHQRGNFAGSETLKINVYSSNDTLKQSVLFSSNEVALSNVDLGEFSLFDLRFDFSGQFLKSGNSYTLELEAANYTRNLDDYYLAYILDHPNQINERVVADEAGAAVAIFGRIV